METLSTIFALTFLASIVALLIFGIKWFRGRKDKESVKYKRNKLYTWISVGVLVVSFIGIGYAEGVIEEREIAQERKEYKSDKSEFYLTYFLLWGKTEDLSQDEGDEWENAIDNSNGDDFDIDATISSIEKKHDKDINDVQSDLDGLRKLNKRIQDNDQVSSKDKKVYQTAYENLRDFANHAIEPSGSYNDFIDEHNEYDTDVSNSYNDLKDL